MKFKMLIVIGGAVYLIDQNTSLFSDIKSRLNIDGMSTMQANFMFADNGNASDFSALGDIQKIGSDFLLSPIVSIAETISNIGNSESSPIATFKDAVTFATGGTTKDLLDLIAKGEGTSDAQAKRSGYSSGYDVPLGYGQFSKDKRRLTSMTLDELYEYQRAMLPNQHNSTACGRYQIVSRTLFGKNKSGGLVKNMGLSGSVIFSPALQDAMAVELLNGRGYKKFKAGNMSLYDFQAGLSKEWASIAHPSSGASHYGQATGTSSADIQNLLKSMV